jgi:hypothetical protein
MIELEALYFLSAGEVLPNLQVAIENGGHRF